VLTISSIPGAGHIQSYHGRLMRVTLKPDLLQISPVTSWTLPSATIQSWHMQGRERLYQGELSAEVLYRLFFIKDFRSTAKSFFVSSYLELRFSN